MVGHYIVSAFRTFRQQKTVTLINVLCLALGLAAFIVAYSVVRYLETAERHFANAARIYLISTELTLPSEGRPLNTLVTADHVAKYLKQEFPYLEAVTRVLSLSDTSVSANGQKVLVQGVAADPDFLDVFDLKFAAGDAATALSQPRSILITAAVAQALYGSVDVLGRKAIVDGSVDVTITGVIERLPASSHFDFEILASWDVREAFLAAGRQQASRPPAPEIWLSLGNVATYVLLPERDLETRQESLMSGLAGFAAKYVPDDQRSSYNPQFNAVALNSLQLARLDQRVLANVDSGISVPAALIVLASSILALACINYASLATAQAIDRFKEIGTRRIVGATHMDVLLQSITGTLLLAIGAMVFAALLVLAIAPLIDQALDVEIRKVALSDGVLWSVLPLLVLLITATGGTYVACRSATVSPASAMKSATCPGSSGLGRDVAVGFQFATTSLLVTLLIVMGGQAQTLKANALGPQQESIVLLTNHLRDARVPFEVYKNANGVIPGVQTVSGTFIPPWSTPHPISMSSGPSADARRLSVDPHSVDKDFFSAMDIPVLAGRTLDPKFGKDVPGSRENTEGADGATSLVIDRKLAGSMGWTPEEAIGQLLYDPPFPGPAPATWQPWRIVGVVESRPLSVTGDGTHGTTYNLTPNPPQPMVRVSAANLPAVLREMEKVWTEIAPSFPLEIRYADAAFDEGFRPFQMIFHFLNGLVALAVGIASGGLIAMAMHETRNRFHEIAIRKTLGAGTGTIALDLLRRLSLPVLIGNLVALPFAYLVSQAYLGMFSFRIDLSISPFLYTLGISLLTIWIAVGFQVLRAARLNPATVLRYE